MIPFNVKCSYYLGAPGLVAGRNLHPKFALQIGITLTNASGSSAAETTPMSTLLPPLDTYTGLPGANDYRPGVFVPLTIRYSFSKPFRRFQPYLFASLQAYFSKHRFTQYAYENGRMTGATGQMSRWNSNGAGAAAGLGLRLRFVDRFSVFGELSAARTYQQYATWVHDPATDSFLRQGNSQLTIPGGVGLVYEFR